MPELLHPTEVKLFVPFKYESKNPYETYMIIGTIKNNHYTNPTVICLILDRQGYVYCDELQELDLVKSASNKNEFVKSLLDKNTWDSEDPQTVSFFISIGKDHRDQSKLKDF